MDGILISQIYVGPNLQLVQQIHRDRCFLLLNCPLTNNPAIFPNYVVMKWSTDTVLYIYYSCYKCHLTVM